MIAFEGHQRNKNKKTKLNIEYHYEALNVKFDEVRLTDYVR